MKRKKSHTILLISLMVIGFTLTILSFILGDSVLHFLSKPKVLKEVTTVASKINLDKMFSYVERLIAMLATGIPAFILLRKK